MWWKREDKFAPLGYGRRESESLLEQIARMSHEAAVVRRVEIDVNVAGQRASSSRIRFRSKV
jgi:hypothetical protein